MTVSQILLSAIFVAIYLALSDFSVTTPDPESRAVVRTYMEDAEDRRTFFVNHEPRKEKVPEVNIKSLLFKLSVIMLPLVYYGLTDHRDKILSVLGFFGSMFLLSPAVLRHESMVKSAYRPVSKLDWLVHLGIGSLSFMIVDKLAVKIPLGIISAFALLAGYFHALPNVADYITPIPLLLPPATLGTDGGITGAMCVYVLLALLYKIFIACVICQTNQKIVLTFLIEIGIRLFYVIIAVIFIFHYTALVGTIDWWKILALLLAVVIP
jgi:hypothetical protein